MHVVDLTLRTVHIATWRDADTTRLYDNATPFVSFCDAPTLLATHVHSLPSHLLSLVFLSGVGGNDWKAAARWLTAVGALPRVDPSMGDGAPTCLDLILFLKDGTVLCQAANAIQPGLIPGEMHLTSACLDLAVHVCASRVFVFFFHPQLCTLTYQHHKRKLSTLLIANSATVHTHHPLQR